jgi:hypothetical protein
MPPSVARPTLQKGPVHATKNRLPNSPKPLFAGRCGKNSTKCGGAIIAGFRHTHSILNRNFRVYGLIEKLRCVRDLEGNRGCSCYWRIVVVRFPKRLLATLRNGVRRVESTLSSTVQEAGP